MNDCTKKNLKVKNAEFNIRKFVFIGALFTVGVADLPEGIDLSLVLYLVPFISLFFDLYIIGEDYGIKRMGGFIREQYKDTMDSNWENWVSKRRDPFSSFAVPILTLIILVTCIAILWRTQSDYFLFWIWLVFIIGGIVFMQIYSHRLKKKLIKD